MSGLLDAPADVMRFYVRGVIYRAACEDIIYMESQNRCVQVHTREREIFVPYLKLCECMEKAGGHFVQCHRSILVNPKYIHEIQLSKKRIILREGRGELMIGRKYVQDLRRIFDVGGISQYTEKDIEKNGA